jgi:hypothetical protein
MFRDSIESLPVKDREAALIAKSDALFELACRVQDDPRKVCGRVKHSDKARATILAKVAARDGPVGKVGEPQ